MKIGKLNFYPIIKYLKPHRRSFYVAIFFVVMENAIQLILPIFYGKALDIVIRDRAFSQTVMMLIGAWFLLSILSEWFMRIRLRRGIMIGFRAAVDMFTNSINHLIRLPLSFHKEKKVGEIIERFDRADMYLDKIINGGLLQIIPHFVTTILALVVIAWIRWELAIIYAFFILIFIFVMISKTDSIIKFNQKISQQLEKVYGNLFERMPNVATIKANTAEVREYRESRKEYETVSEHIDDYTGLWMNLQFLQHFVFSSGFLALFALGLYFIGLNLITVGQFVMLLAYVNMASSSIQTLGSNYKELHEGLAVINRSEKIYDEKKEEYGNTNAKELAECKGAVEFRNVGFSHGRRQILNGINFKVKPGQMVAIVGRSGQGKTTLMDMIPRFFDPSKGMILLDGINIKKIKLENLRKHIGIVSQEIGMFHSSIKSNIKYSRTGARVSEIMNVAKIAHCHEFVQKFPKGYDAIVGDRGVRLSIGQRQRIAIARAVLRDPKILILDEATSALDSESEKLVQEALVEIMKNRTTFVIAHRLSTIRRADLILVIEDGEIVERGNHAELMRHGGVYKKLHELQHVSV